MCSGLTVEAKVNSLTGYHCRVVRNALVDVDTGVVTLAPCYELEVSVDLTLSVGLLWGCTLVFVKRSRACSEKRGNDRSGDLHAVFLE